MFRRDIPIHFLILFSMFLKGCASPSSKAHDSVPLKSSVGQPTLSGSFLEKLNKEHSYKEPLFLAQSEGASQGIFLNSPERILWIKNKGIEMQDFADKSPVQRFLQNTPQNWVHVSWSKKQAKLFLTSSEKALPSPWDLSVKEKADLFTFDFEGGKLTQFTRSVAYNGEAAVSPDGEWIAFSSGRDGDLEIYLVRSNGNDIQRVTHRSGYDGDPSFSPDGKFLLWRAFRADRKDVSDLYLASLRKEGSRLWVGSPKNLTEKENSLFLTPSWHPESTHVIFASNRASKAQLDLYLADIDFRCVQRITNSSESEIFPTISSDGRFLMWTGKSEKGQGLFLSPFSFVKAPCDGSRTGVELTAVELKGVNGK